MAGAEDNLDLDVYDEVDGDGAGNDNEADYYEEDEHTFTVDEPTPNMTSDSNNNFINRESTSTPTVPAPKPSDRKASPTEGSVTVPSRGVKRKDSPSSRPIESGATNALLISELHWWITEDDIRGWVNQAGAEHDLIELTFSEHKVNGKSKG